MSSYASLTLHDRSSVKRWFQRRRLRVAIELLDASEESIAICDYGAGNAEVSKHLATHFPNARFVAFEPTPIFMEEARENVAGLDQIHLVASTSDIGDHSIDILYCLEVLEHLPLAETIAALDEFDRILRPGGTAVIGVPVEIWIPALYRGLFRMTRRWGQPDSTPLNIIRATLGFPPKDREMIPIATGIPYYHLHIGFDHRRLRRLLETRFRTMSATTSPFMALGTLLNSELYWVCRK